MCMAWLGQLKTKIYSFGVVMIIEDWMENQVLLLVDLTSSYHQNSDFHQKRKKLIAYEEKKDFANSKISYNGSGKR